MSHVNLTTVNVQLQHVLDGITFIPSILGLEVTIKNTAWLSRKPTFSGI